MNIVRYLYRKVLVFIIFLCLIISVSNIHSANFGTSTAEFLKIKTEAGPAGMGETGIGFADGTASLIYNPSGLGSLDKSELNFTNLVWFNNINMLYGAFVYPFDMETGIGVNLLWIDFGEFDSTGNVAPAIQVQNGLLTLGFGKNIGKVIKLGITGKALYENFFGETSFGVSFDAGMMVNLYKRNITLGVVARNLGFLSGTEDLLPIEAGVGLAFRFYEGSFDFANIAVDFTKIINTDNIFAGVGVEYYLMKVFAIRFGVRYNNALDIDDIDFANIQKLMLFSGGMGLDIGDAFGIDYSFTPMGDIGVIHRISGKIKFGESLFEQWLAEQNAEFIPKAIEVPKVNIEEGRISSVSFKPNVPEEKVKEWTLSIKTSEGVIVKTFKGVGEVPKNLTWDGTDNIGAIAKADANYVFDFKAKNLKGKVIKTIGQIVQPKKYEFIVPEDKRFVPLKGKEMLVAPVTLLVSSDKDERKQVPFVMVNEKIKVVKDWKFEVRKGNGELIKTFAGKGNMPSYLVWDGKDANGAYVDDLKNCKYELSLNGVDGEKAKVREKQIVRDPFVIASVSKKLKLAKKIYFEQNTFDIHPAMEKRLAIIAAEIKRNKNVQVYIQGHSSGEGDRGQNIMLSQERAKVVLRHLVEKYNISPLSVTTVGYGADVPSGPNDTEEHRRLNRRAEIIIMGEKSSK